MKRLALATSALLLVVALVYAGSYNGPTGVGSVGPAGPTGATGPSGLTAGIWASGTTYHAGDLVLGAITNCASGCGGTWQATGTSTGSQPISGNANWALVAGTPYVSMVLDPVALTTAPFLDAAQTGPGLVIIPSPGPNLLVLPVDLVTVVGPGDGWASDASLRFKWGSASGSIPVGLDTTPKPFIGLGGSSNTHQFALTNSFESISATEIDQPMVVYTPDDLIAAGPPIGSSSATIYLWYEVRQVASGATGTFYVITAVNQGAKTLTVTDAGAILNGATGTFAVVGSTGNNATYTIVSSVSGAGSTVITTVEAIPDATADGWVRRP